jgi:hypothetical protein
MYSTVPPWLQLALSLIDAITGAPGGAFPPPRLGSGIAGGRIPEPFHQSWPLSEDLTAARVFVTAFIHQNLAQNTPAVNGFSASVAKSLRLAPAVWPDPGARNTDPAQNGAKNRLKFGFKM